MQQDLLSRHMERIEQLLLRHPLSQAQTVSPPPPPPPPSTPSAPAADGENTAYPGVEAPGGASQGKQQRRVRSLSRGAQRPPKPLLTPLQQPLSGAATGQEEVAAVSAAAAAAAASVLQAAGPGAEVAAAAGLAAGLGYRQSSGPGSRRQSRSPKQREDSDLSSWTWNPRQQTPPTSARSAVITAVPSSTITAATDTTSCGSSSSVVNGAKLVRRVKCPRNPRVRGRSESPQRAPEQLLTEAPTTSAGPLLPGPSLVSNQDGGPGKLRISRSRGRPSASSSGLAAVDAENPTLSPTSSLASGGRCDRAGGSLPVQDLNGIPVGFGVHSTNRTHIVAFAAAATGVPGPRSASVPMQENLLLTRAGAGHGSAAPVLSAELGFSREGAAEVGLGSSSQTRCAPLSTGTTATRGKSGGVREA